MSIPPHKCEYRSIFFVLLDSCTAVVISHRKTPRSVYNLEVRVWRVLRTCLVVRYSHINTCKQIHYLPVEGFEFSNEFTLDLIRIEITIT